jgi:catechol 2,3-dioxygenase-like lactoylglutathione lyase family enzyme
MFAKLNHLAIISDNYERSAKFYEVMFGMRTASGKPRTNGAAGAGPQRPAFASTVGDGYVGLNINPRRPGRPARFEHFGIEVEDAETVFARMKEKYPRVKSLKRPSNRPFAGITTHDPDGNVFDISQKDMANRRDIYTEQHELNPSHVDHFAFRTMNPDAMAEFYREIFELEPRNRKEDDPNHYLSDGHITMVIMPWDITDYDGTGIAPPSMEHIGFTVENLEAFKSYVDYVAGENRFLAPQAVDGGVEGRKRLELARRSCPLCQHHLSDIDGVWLSASER